MSSPRFNVSLVEIETSWSLEDVWDANIVLDCLDELEGKASQMPSGR